MDEAQPIRIEEMTQRRGAFYCCDTCREPSQFEIFFPQYKTVYLCRSHAQDLKACLEVALEKNV